MNDHIKTIGFVSLWFERGQAYVTKILCDTLVPEFNVEVLARNAVNDPGRLIFSSAKEFNLPCVSHYPNYMINPADFEFWLKKTEPDAVVFNEEYQDILVNTQIDVV